MAPAHGGPTEAILGLTWDSADLDAWRTDLGPAVGRNGRAVAPIDDALLHALREAREGATRPTAVKTPGGAAVRSVKAGFRAAARRAGLSGLTPRGSGTWPPPGWRWTACPMWQIAMLLGHRDTTTMGRAYAEHHPEYVAGATAALAARFPGSAGTANAAGTEPGAGGAAGQD